MTLLVLSSCVRDLNDAPYDGGRSIATLIIGPDDVATRSSVGSTDAELEAFENKITDLTLFRFLVSGSTETYDSAEYFDLSSGSGATRTVKVTGETGQTYKYYALLNCGDMSGELTSGSLSGITLDGLTISSMKSSGIPMVNRDGVSVTFGTTASATIPMTRLVARWDFKLDVSAFTHGGFSVSNVKLRQASTRAMPFASSFQATSSSYVQDGDAISIADKSYLSSGGTVTFYTLENACGNLLPSNGNPYCKVPTSGTSISGKYPTYLEVTGTFFSNDGLTLSTTYRMFLGKDNCKNFDVIRGYRYTLTLSPTEDSIIERNDDDCWKVEMTELMNNRNFQFVRDNYAIPYGKSGKFDTIHESSAMGIYYSLSSSISGVASVSTSSKTLTNKSSSYKTGTLIAYYWDGTEADRCTVILGHSAYEPPTGLYVVSNDTDTSISGWYHDPDCKKVHHYHDPTCTLNHSDHLAPNYVPIESCPNQIDDTDKCTNKTRDDYGFSRANYSFRAADITSYANSGPKYDYRSDMYLRGASFGPKSNPDSGFIVESSNQYGKGSAVIAFGDGAEATISVNKDSDGKLSCGVQTQGGGIPDGYNTWSVTVGKGNSTYVTYNLPTIHETGQWAQTIEAPPTVSFAMDDDIQKYTVSCSTSDAVYLVSDSDYIQLINLSSSSHSNVFHDGDKMIVAVATGAPNKVRLLAMTSNGQKIGEWDLGTASVNSNGPSISAWVTFQFCLYSGFYSFKPGLSVSAVNGDVGVNPTVSSSQYKTLTSSDYSITNYNQYTYVTVNNYYGYYYFDLLMPATLTFGSRTIEANLRYTYSNNTIITLE